jgi:hypothetical protein
MGSSSDLKYKCQPSAKKIIFVFIVLALVSSLSTVAFVTDNLAFASSKKDDSSGGGGDGGSGDKGDGSSSSSGGDSSDNGGGGSDNSNSGSSTEKTSTTPPPPTEQTTPTPPPSNQQICPDGSTPDANGLCPVLPGNSAGLTTIPDTSSTGTGSISSPTTSGEGTSGNSASSGSDNNIPPPPFTTPDSSSGTGSSTPTPANQGTSSSGSSASSSSTTTPSNSKTPQTGVSQSAAIAAANQIINSPGSTIVNQQSIKQSVKINNEVNNIIRKNVISQSSSSSSATSATSSSTVISNLITVKLATTASSMSRNAYLPIGDIAPYRLIGGHVTANLPNNHLYVVVAQLASNNGAIQHAVVLDMIKSQISNIFETDLGSQISGTNPLTGKQDVVSNITNLFLWNNGNQQVTFVDANAVTMNLIYR